MRPIFIIALGLLAFGCKPTKRTITGTYNKYSDFENWYSLEINKNNEFKFDGQEGIIRIQTNGRWELIGDALILNSFENERPSIITFAKTLPSNQLTIYVVDMEQRPIEGVYVDLIHHGIATEKRTDVNGSVTFPNDKYDSLDVGFLGYQRLLTKLPHDGSNEFSIKLMEDYDVFYQLKDQYFKVKWRRLVADSLPSDNSKQILRK